MGPPVQLSLCRHYLQAVTAHSTTTLVLAAAACVYAYYCLPEQVATEQRRHKLSYHLMRATPEQDAAVLQVNVASTQRVFAVSNLRTSQLVKHHVSACCTASSCHQHAHFAG